MNGMVLILWPITYKVRIDVLIFGANFFCFLDFYDVHLPLCNGVKFSQLMTISEVFTATEVCDVSRQLRICSIVEVLKQRSILKMSRKYLKWLDFFLEMTLVF